MTLRHAGLGLALALACVLPAWGQSYPAPTFQGLTILADPTAATQAARKGYVDATISAGIAANVSGTISIAHGGTGQTTAAAGLAALGGFPLTGGSVAGTLSAGTNFPNYITMSGSPPGYGTPIGVAGSDANISLVLTAKGTGTIYAANPMQLTTALSIPNGGTGQTTPAAALAALGGYAASNPAGYITSAISGSLSINDPATGAAASAQITATSNSQGAGLKLVGPGSVTPSKTIRAMSGQFQIVNDAYNSIPFALDDAGNLAISGGLGATTASINAAVAAERVVNYQTSGVLRFKAGLAATSEPGANAGSDYALYRYADNGAYIGRAFAVTRASGLLTIDVGANVTGTLTTTGLAAFGGATAISDTTEPVQINSFSSQPAYFGANRAGAYGTLFGYDPNLGGGVVRQVTSDPINVITNNTTVAAQFTADGNTRFPGIATAATVRVGTTAGPTWTTGTGAPTSTQPIGSIYSRTDGGIGSTLYVSHGGGTWNTAMGQ